MCTSAELVGGCGLSSAQGVTSMDRMPGWSNAEKQPEGRELPSSAAGNGAGNSGDAFKLLKCLVGGLQCSESEFVTVLPLFLRQTLLPERSTVTILYQRYKFLTGKTV